VLGRNRPAATARVPAACHAWKAGWATAWPTGPAAEAARALRVGWLNGALTGGPVAASRRQGLELKHHGPAADALGKGSGGEAHRCGGTMAGQSGGSVWRRAMASSLEGGSAASPVSSGSCGRGREG
jgi:hypothetical protein